MTIEGRFQLAITIQEAEIQRQQQRLALQQERISTLNRLQVEALVERAIFRERGLRLQRENTLLRDERVRLQARFGGFQPLQGAAQQVATVQKVLDVLAFIQNGSLVGRQRQLTPQLLITNLHCAICLQPPTDGRSIVLSQVCDHSYCAECVGELNAANSACPSCREGNAFPRQEAQAAIAIPYSQIFRVFGFELP